jgi:hypothetical protein
MTNSRPPVSGRDVAGAGALLLTVNLLFAAIGAGLGALVRLTVPFMLLGFAVGFFLGIYVVIKRFRDF